ncbi:Piso0_005070 [Millerozyma farinosa CBS 7064]|uniref:Exosome complex protein n=1 Tax=Pichia sorbitophila (strain ATCC MYA-4447 / BCRC 22081 / CBS 7064 / NBRC 10061 / NRRL Y-12695) TaxID=559304 RepID=G8Y455_PICSO|nr:Piso0_005070 [Millerozyma farinosa CBS 7064]
MENIEKVRKFAQVFDESVNDFNEGVDPILRKTLDELATSDNALKSLKAYNSYGYILISSLYAYLKSTGMDTKDHPIMKELERIKLYMKKAKDIESRMAVKDSTDENTSSVLKTILGKDSEPNSPAISSSNFKGTHTKFEDSTKHENAPKSKDGNNNKSPEASKYKVSKPSKSKKKK